jgi:hypothetical protein
MSALPNLYRAENGWRKHPGGACPIPLDTRVNLQFAGGSLSNGERRAGDFIWDRRGWDFDIAAYQVTNAEDLR